MSDLVNKVIIHELSGTADFKRRKKFYNEIVNCQHNQKIALSEQLQKNIDGAKFVKIQNFDKSVFDKNYTVDLKKFRNDGYVYPFKITKKAIDDILHHLKDLEFKNTWNNHAICGSDFIEKNGEIIYNQKARGTYWLTEEQRDYTNFIQSQKIQDLAFDPFILNTVAGYLGATPIHVATNVWYSTQSDDVDEQKRNAQRYHQDAGFINFVKVFIYLSDTSGENGAHQFISGSHRIDPKKLIADYFTSQRYEDQELSDALGAANCMVITGSKGDVIFGDTSCFHKGGVVSRGCRLMLNFEYTTTLFGSGVNYFNADPVSSQLIDLPEDIRNRATLNYNKKKYKQSGKFWIQFQQLKHKILVSIKNMVK